MFSLRAPRISRTALVFVGVLSLLWSSAAYAGLDLYATGNNESGQFGNNTKTSSSAPVKVAPGVAAMAAGVAYNWTLLDDGTLWAAGSNYLGRLGDGTTTDRLSPVKIADNVTQIAAGIFLKRDGSVWWVRTRNSFEPVLPEQIGTDGTMVAAGGEHVVFLKRDGSAWGVGSSLWGQVGPSGPGGLVSTPVQLGTGVARVRAGGNQTFLIKTDGSLWGLGSNRSGELGLDFVKFDSVQTAVKVAADVTDATAGTNFTLFVKTDGSLWGLGNNSSGQLGDGTLSTRGQPVRVAEGVATVAAGTTHSLFLKTDHSLWGMGSGRTGELGANASGNTALPVLIATTVQSCAAANYFSLFTKDAGGGTATQVLLTPAAREIGAEGGRYIVRAASAGEWTAKTSTSWLSVPVVLPATDGFVEVAVARNPTGASRTGTVQIGGSVHTVTQRAPGAPFPELLAVGSDLGGQLGTGRKLRSGQAVQIATGITAAAVAPYFSYREERSFNLVLRTDGTLWGSGANDFGQLGNGEVATVSAWSQIATSVRAFSAGAGLTYYITRDDRLWRLGGAAEANGNPIPGPPIEVAQNVASVSAGWSHCLFIKRDGTLWALGSNADGQLGNGTTVASAAPVLVAANVASASAGQNHSFFITTNGTLWGMGANAFGCLGQGDNFVRFSSPIQISTDVRQATAGGQVSVFVKTDFTAWVMGGDKAYQQRVQVATNVESSSASRSGIHLLHRDGAVSALGSNYTGELGTKGTVVWPVPEIIATEVAMVSTGERHSLLVKRDGTLWAMGEGKQFLWLNETNPLVLTSGVAQVAAGNTHSLFTRQDGTLWGMGGAGIAEGLGNTATPQLIADSVTRIAAGSDFSAYVRQDGGLWEMGSASVIRQTGTQNLALYPGQVLTGASQVAAGYSHLLAVKTDGSLWATGDNYYGQLGIGKSADAFTQVQAAPNAVDIAGSFMTSLFASRDGGLWVMGASGLPSVTEAETRFPKRIAENAVRVAAGAYHSLYLTTRGELWGFGEDNFGGGSPLRYQRFTAPVLVANDVTSVAATANQTFFIKSDASLWAAGENPNGALGDGTFSRRTVPVQVARGVTAVSAGGAHTLFIRESSLPLVAAPVAVRLGEDGGFLISAEAAGALTYQWQRLKAGGTAWEALTEGAEFGNVRTAGLRLSATAALTPGDRFRCQVVGTAGTVASVSLVVTAPVLTRQPAAVQAAAGAVAEFTATATGVPLPRFRWERKARNSTTWLPYSSPAPRDETTSVLQIPNVSAEMDGDLFRCIALNGASPDAVSTEARLTVGSIRLANLSVLTRAGAGSQALTLGFVLGGAGAKPILTRAVGPGLSRVSATTDYLPDPRLRLFAPTGEELAVNDDWGGGGALSAAFIQAGAFSLAPDSKDAALLPTLSPGAYTAQASTLLAGASGLVLVEVYDPATASGPRLVNLSILKKLSAADGGLTVGFVLTGSGSKSMLIRGVGPSLSQFGIASVDTLADPRLTLLDQNGVEVAVNDNWGGTPALKSAFGTLGAFGLTSDTTKDAAMLVTLQPGPYSVRVDATGPLAGFTLVEIYDVP